MRTFHTNTYVCGVSQDVHAGAIGRLHPSCEHTHAHKIKSESHPSSPGDGFDSFSRHDAMRDSLREGIQYYDCQISGLNRTELILRQVSQDIDLIRKGSFAKENPSKRTFFHQALDSLSREKFKSFPVFGHGHESPTRIHLKIDNKRLTKLLSPVPLLSSPAFRSVYLSLVLNQDVPTGLCEESVGEVLNFMLSVKSQQDELSDLAQQIVNQRSTVRQSLGHRSISNSGFLRRIISKFSKSLTHRFPRPIPEVPI